MNNTRNLADLEREYRIERKITFMGVYCWNCAGRERYTKNKQCYRCKINENNQRYRDRVK